MAGPGAEREARSLSVVIPAFQEARRLGPTLQRICAYLDRAFPGSEVIVVDDGSTDGTTEVAETQGARCLVHPSNRGKGAAVRTGVLAASRQWVLVCDADLSTPVEEVESLFAAVDAGADIAIGSRALRDSRVEARQPLYRMLMGKTFNKIMRAVVWLPFVDTQCGFKLFPTPVAQRLFAAARIDGFAFDVEVLWLARRAGLSVAEVPVRWRNAPQSTVHPVFHSAEMLRDVLRVRWIHRGGQV